LPSYSTQPINWRQFKDANAGAAAPTGAGPNGATNVKIVPFQTAPRGQTPCDPRVPQTPHAAGILCGMGDGSVRTTSATISARPPDARSRRLSPRSACGRAGARVARRAALTARVFLVPRAARGPPRPFSFFLLPPGELPPRDVPPRFV